MESAGTFTLDAASALDKLRSFQVDKPHHYVNRLVRSAYRCQAPWVEIASSNARTRVVFPSLATDLDHLDRLLERLFQDHGSSGHDFAEATNFALSLPQSRVEIRLDDGTQARVLVLSLDKVEAFETVSNGSVTTTFQLFREGGAALRSWGLNSPEYMNIVRRFRYSPLSIRINGETPPTAQTWGGPARKFNLPREETIALAPRLLSFSRRYRRAHHSVEIRYFDPDLSKNGVGLLKSEATGLVQIGDPHPSGEDRWRCRNALGLCLDRSRRSTASFVYCGETIQVFPVELDLKGLELLITANDLKLDLSGERIVQDAAFEELWAGVKSEVDRLAQSFRKAYSGDRVRGNVKALFDPQLSWRTFFLDRAPGNVQPVDL